MIQSELRSPREVIDCLGIQPSILLTSQRSGTRLYLETTGYSYELTLLDPLLLTMEIVSNDPRISARTVGVFERSVYDEKGSAFFVARIVEGMRMQIRFANDVFRSRPVVTATVLGKDWHYKVF